MKGSVKHDQLRVAHPIGLITAVLMVLLSFGAAWAAAAPARADTPSAQSVQDFLDAYRHRHGLPGVEVAVVKDGQIVLETGSGDGVTAHTPWGIGSTTKPVTAFAVLQLVDSGALDLDDRVVDHLPEFRMDDSRAAAITVRQLLSHTSGLPNPTLVPMADSTAQRVTQLRSTKLSAAPGTRYAYSNLNYQVAARLIEVVSRQNYSDYLRDHVFAPLGMTDTVATVTKSDQAGYRDGHATAYGLSLPLPELTAMNAGSGDLISTSHDMASWLAMYQRGGTAPDGTRLLSKELIKQSLTDQPGAGNNTLGWQHTQTSVPERVGKDGTLTRFSSRIDLVPSSGYGVVVMLNSYTPTLKHPFEISSGVIALTEGHTPDLGFPMATVTDLILALITLGVVALVIRGALRAPRWAARRSNWPHWRYALRLVPQALMPIAAIVLFGALPLINHNASTPVDAFGLWPAATTLVLGAAIGGAVLIALRIKGRIRKYRSVEPR